MAGFTKVVIKWEPVKKANAYKVYRNGKVIETVKETEHPDTKLKSGTVFSYQIIAVGEDKESRPSQVLKVKTLNKMSGYESWGRMRII